MIVRCLAPRCQWTGDSWRDAVEHRRDCEHDDYGETFVPERDDDRDGVDWASGGETHASL